MILYYTATMGNHGGIIMTLAQTLAFNSFLKANGLTKEDVRTQLNDEVIQHDRDKVREIAKKLEAEKAALEGRYFLSYNTTDSHYYKVVSTKTWFSNKVTCLMITEHPHFEKGDIFIELCEPVALVEVDVKSFEYYEEISAAEFEEAMFTWAKDVLCCEYSGENEE